MPVWLVLGIVASLLSALLTPLAAQAGVRSTGGYVCTIVGTKSNDVLRGTAKRDVICGRGGNDIIKGGAGNDIIDGGAGKDRLSGGVGNDRIFGAAGNDVLSGNKGTDRLDGGDGPDRLSGGSGNDIIRGGSGDDTIEGGSGADQIVAGQGKDRVSGGSGNDALAGGAGVDRLNGGSGADRLSGDHGNDVLTGAGDGDDLAGGAGNDTVTGASGDDTLSGGSGVDRVDGGSGFNLCDIPDAGDQHLRCAIDEDAPVVGAVVPSLSTVDVSAAPKVVLVKAHVTDDTGVRFVQIGPEMARLVSGNQRAGVWQAAIEVPRFSKPGPRSLSINARDRVGRAGIETRENVYTVVNDRIDQEMPVLTSLSLSATSVDARPAAQPMTATITVTDDLAGAKDVVLCLVRPTPGERGFGENGGCKPMSQLSGGPQSSTWRGTVPVPQGAVGGTWNVQVWISDAAGNNLNNDLWLGPDEFAALDFDSPRYRPIPGGGGAFTVLGGTPDVQAPELRSVTLTPSIVDTSRGAVRVTANVSGTDDEGIRAIALSVSGQSSTPGFRGWVDVALLTDFQLVSGTTQNGTWQGTFVVPGGTPDGRYFIQTTLSDRGHSPSWVSPGSGWVTAGTLDETPVPSTTHFVVANTP